MSNKLFVCNVNGTALLAQIKNCIVVLGECRGEKDGTWKCPLGD